MAQARGEAREGMGVEVRIRLLEVDADDFDSAIEAINERLMKLTWAVTGAALSLTTASIMLAINLSLTGGP